MRATGPPGAAVASCVCVASRRTRYGANAAAVEITTSSPAVPLNEYRSARTLAPKMGEVQSDVSSAPALTSPTVIGAIVHAAPRKPAAARAPASPGARPVEQTAE